MNPVESIRAASRQLVRELRVLNGDSPLPELSISECHVLTELDLRGRLTATELADTLVLEKSTVSRLVRRLTRRGLVEAQSSPGDRRQRPLVLTDAGREQVSALHGLANQQVAEALAYLPPEARREVAESLDRYARSLRYARLSADFRIRPIRPDDDPAVARIITEVMTEFGAVGEGYSIQDPEVQAMSAAYADERSAFWVVEDRHGELQGCGGVAQLEGGDRDTCELRKMYFMPALRGTGMGTRLLAQCLDAAAELGYRRCYLETLQSMHQARHLYRKMGFVDLEAPLGNTGHSGCNRWMARTLSPAEAA